MSLSCFCEYQGEPGDVLWDRPLDYSVTRILHARRCASCQSVILNGDTVAAFYRYKVPESDIELKIYGETDEAGPKRATHYHCERCGDLYFSLVELGYCVDIYNDMRELVREYAEMNRGR